MKEIIALQQYTDKFISLYQGEIRNIQDSLADKLIEEGIVAQHSDDGSQGGGDANIIKVNFTPGDAELISDKTYNELIDAINAGKILMGILIVTMENNGIAVLDTSWISFYTGTFNVTFDHVYRMMHSGNEWTS